MNSHEHPIKSALHLHPMKSPLNKAPKEGGNEITIEIVDLSIQMVICHSYVTC